MNIKKLLVDFVTVFAVTLIVSVIVTLLSNLIVHGASTIDWDSSFRSAVLFGIVFSWIETRRTTGRKCAPLVRAEAIAAVAEDE
jgi:hypothetical protein